MKKLFVLCLGLTFLLVMTNDLWATISRVDGQKCSNVAAVLQGGNSTFYVQGPGVDLATTLTTSNSAISARILRKWNGAQNLADFGNNPQTPGNIAWGRIQISVSATVSAPAQDHYVYIKYPMGQDRLTIKVIRKAVITGFEVIPPFTKPIFGNVDIKFTGAGLSGARVSDVRFKVDAYNPLLNALGESVTLSPTGAYISGIVNTSTNTDSQADVRLTFTSDLPRLIKATIVITFSGPFCNGLPVSYTFTLIAPKGPNAVFDHVYDRLNRTYNPTETVNVTIRLVSPVAARTLPISTSTSRVQSPTAVRDQGQAVYWAVQPSNAVRQTPTTGTPYDQNARYNVVYIPVGQQSKLINFQVGPFTTTTVNLITWMPDPNNDTWPNRIQSTFRIPAPRP